MSLVATKLWDVPRRPKWPGIVVSDFYAGCVHGHVPRLPQRDTLMPEVVGSGVWSGAVGGAFLAAGAWLAAAGAVAGTACWDAAAASR